MLNFNNGAPQELLIWHSTFLSLGQMVQLIMIITNSINSSLIGSRCITNGTHTNHCLAKLAHASKPVKLLTIVCGSYNSNFEIIIRQQTLVNSIHDERVPCTCLSYNLKFHKQSVFTFKPSNN